MLSKTLVFAVFGSGAFAFPSLREAELSKRDDSFSLYAYGADMGGYSIKYNDGGAYAVHPKVNSSSFVDIKFAFGTANASTLSIAPAKPADSFNETYQFGFDDSGNGNVGFQSQNTSGFHASDWMLYGKTLARLNSEGNLVSNFVVENQDTGIFNLRWNPNSTNTNAVALRLTAPSS